MTTVYRACLSPHLTDEARDKTAMPSLRLLAVLNVPSSTPPRAKRLAPRPGGLLTHFVSPRGEKGRLGGPTHGSNGAQRGESTAIPLRLARSPAPAQGWARWWLALGLVLTLGLFAAEPAVAGERSAKKLHRQGRKAELAKDYDKALELYEQAASEAPEDPRYQLAARRTRFVAGQTHVEIGRRQREQGHLEEAVAEFQRALEIDPASTVAAQEHRGALDLIEERSKRGDAGGDFDTTTPLEREREKRERKLGRLKSLPELEPISSRPLEALTFRKQESKVIFETIGKLAGINVLFDAEYDDKEISIELSGTTLHEALDYVGLLAKAFWKPLTKNAIFVTNDDTNKRREYDDEVVKTFYLSNVATPQELQEIATAIRGLTDIRRLFPVNSMNALIVRGPKDKVALAEKVITDVDKARPEVIIDVLVLETSKSATRDLGIAPISGGAAGIDLPVSFTGAGVGAGEGVSVPLTNLGNVSGRDWSTVLPNGVIQALMSRSDTRLLQAPRVRAQDNFQASLRIGERIPIATGSFGSGIGAGIGGGIPLVNTQFQYQEVGVNVDLTPKIHNNREVSMHVEIEISNVADFVDLGGITQPVIGQRKVSHDIRIKDAEASVLGGLLQTSIFKTRAGIPLLGDIPILGRLFSTEQTTVDENEVLIVLIPHVVRLPEIRRANLKAVASGTDQVFRVRYELPPNDKSPLTKVGVDTEPATKPEVPTVAEAQPPIQTVPAAVPAAAPSPTQPAPATPPEQAVAEVASTTPPAQPVAEQAAPAADPAAGPSLVPQPAAPELAVGQQTTVHLTVQNAAQLFAVPMRIRFDQKFVRLVDITKGEFLQGDEQDLIFSKNIRNEVGQAAVNISRFPGTDGIDGSGVVVSLVLEGVAAGSSDLRVIPTGARDAEAKPLKITSAQATVTVR